MIVHQKMQLLQQFQVQPEGHRRIEQPFQACGTHVRAQDATLGGQERLVPGLVKLQKVLELFGLLEKR